MKKITILLTFTALGFGAYGQTWQLVWSDEFNGSIGPDWVFEIGNGSGGWGNNELQYYRSQNASIVNNALQIQARNESYGGFAYTSARMKTQGRRSWRYGRIEARIQLPSFTGSWPAFWMLGNNIGSVGWPACGEIDIMEHVNTEGVTHGTIHWDYNGYASYSGSIGVNVTSYHVYSIEWDANEIRWYVDGAMFHVANIANSINGTNEFHNNFFVILNMAIGGNWPGFTIDNGALPANMRVDYVRVYQQGATPPPPPPPTGVVTLFQHCNYGGYAVGLGVGSYNLPQLQALGVINDDISSVQVQSGYQVTMYQHWDFTGNMLTKTSNDDCLVNDGFNDDISSVVVSQVSGGGGSWSTLIEAENWAVMNGVQTEACSEGGVNVGWIDPGDWIVWDVNLPVAGTYTVEYRVASLNGGGSLQFERAGGNPVYGVLGVPRTGGWQNWTTISHVVTNLSAGQQQVAIYAPAGGWNINWLLITQGIKSGEDIIRSDHNSVSELILYPNPADDQVFIHYPIESDILQVSVYNMAGNLQIQNVLHGSNSIDVSSLTSGLYILRTIGSDGIYSKMLTIK
ncbi:MAG: family 16 glycosylhydrolase [Bacteroidales bacterium]|nr:family 16 glycosylhydrolase [Bacteroidales bacterium]